MSLVDIIFLVVILASAFLALMRGFFREALGLLSWGIAGFLTYGVYLMARPYLYETAGQSWLVHGLFLAILFAALVIVFTFANKRIVEIFKGESNNAWDQVLGFFFGAARGFLLIALFIKAYELIFTPAFIPQWLVSSKIYPLVSATSNSLHLRTPDIINVRVDESLTIRVPIPIQKDTSPSIEGLVATSSRRPLDDRHGYSRDERGAIDQLLLNTLDPP